MVKQWLTLITMIIHGLMIDIDMMVNGYLVVEGELLDGGSYWSMSYWFTWNIMIGDG